MKLQLSLEDKQTLKEFEDCVAKLMPLYQKICEVEDDIRNLHSLATRVDSIIAGLYVETIPPRSEATNKAKVQVKTEAFDLPNIDI